MKSLASKLLNKVSQGGGESPLREAWSDNRSVKEMNNEIIDHLVSEFKDFSDFISYLRKTAYNKEGFDNETRKWCGVYSRDLEHIGELFDAIYRYEEDKFIDDVKLLHSDTSKYHGRWGI